MTDREDDTSVESNVAAGHIGTLIATTRTGMPRWQS